ncbi:hypothetical protein CLV47_10962 [Antricoccus suffuscus]|uniref:Uncharacterized protein n=1 Tax=Antricoccus suffuscus TaxID=1629062 RepID=A0A2T0ZYT0_9ACTN|nr:hypothetical protein [Antricoccus suffuscus]PRZ41515.1 hypothetical protein CLV47_10962 [Antricoccus suffuscus]
MHAVLIGALVLGTAIWVGGFVMIIVLSRASRAVLQTADRVALFRGFGRGYLPVAGVAMVLIVLPGGVLLGQRPWDGLATTLVILVACTAAATAVGVVQARAMTRLRKAALKAPDDLDRRVRRGAQRALVLRATIGVLTVAMYVVAIACAVT